MYTDKHSATMWFTPDTEDVVDLSKHTNTSCLRSWPHKLGQLLFDLDLHLTLGVHNSAIMAKTAIYPTLKSKCFCLIASKCVTYRLNVGTWYIPLGVGEFFYQCDSQGSSQTVVVRSVQGHLLYAADCHTLVLIHPNASWKQYELPTSWGWREKVSAPWQL